MNLISTVKEINDGSTCVACGSNNSFKLLADFGEIPLSGYYNLDPKLRGPVARMALEFCEKCAFVRKLKAPSAIRDYQEIDRSTAGQLPFYLQDIVGQISEFQSPDELILEVGANDGTFLNELKHQGFSKLGGVEPSLHLAEICRQNGHETFCGYFAQDFLDAIRNQFGQPKTILCRHTLEHIPDPLIFLRAARELLPHKGRIYVEIPSGAWVIDKMQVHEIWDEHENYFTHQSLAACLEMAGFRVLECRDQRHRDACNIVCWASAEESKPFDFTQAVKHELALCQSFPQRLALIQDYVAEISANWHRPAFAIGAAHVQANYAIFSGAGRSLDGFVDDSEWKKGRHLSAPSPLPIISTEELIAIASPLTLVATAFPYPDWMEVIRKKREGRGDNWIQPYPRSVCPLIDVVTS